MKSFLMTVLLAGMVLAFTACGLVEDSQQPDNSPANISSDDDSTKQMNLEGLCLVSEQSYLILTDSGEIIVMYNKTGDENIFSELSSGDRISISCGYIRESFPAQTDISRLELIKEGEFKDIPEEKLDTLKEMGWEIIE